MNYVKKHHDWGILALRIGIGLAFLLVYGYPKITGGPDLWMKLGSSMSNFGINFAPEFWGFMSALTEFGGAILIILGLFTRPAAFFMAFNMLVAMSTHFKALDPWNKVIHPIELFTVFLALLIMGGGRFSIDYFISRKKHIGIKTVDEPVTGSKVTSSSAAKTSSKIASDKPAFKQAFKPSIKRPVE